VFVSSANKLPFFVKSFLTYKLRNLFSGAFDREVDASPLPIDIPQAYGYEINKIASMIRNAKKPVMIVASQATLFTALGPDGVDPDAPTKVGNIVAFPAILLRLWWPCGSTENG
jgi:hypothetical protein